LNANKTLAYDTIKVRDKKVTKILAYVPFTPLKSNVSRLHGRTCIHRDGKVAYTETE